MNNTALMDLSPISFDGKIQGKSKTPSDVGNSLFQDFLEGNSNASIAETPGSSLFAGVKGHSGSGLSGKNNGSDSNNLETLYRKIRDLGLPYAQMMLPESALPQLISFLKGQGLSMEKIDQIIMSARNKDGLLNLNKVLARLAGGEKGKAAEGKGPVVQASHIPRVQEFLFKMGLGAGEVKEAVEKSLNQKGDLDLGRLWAALEKSLPGLGSASGLTSLIEHYDIDIKPHILGDKNIAPDLKKGLMEFIQGSQDLQKKIKQELAAILREKGIPPQEVKSFLETLTVDVTRSRLRDSASKRGDVNLLNQVVIKEKPLWQKGEWNEKILEILRDERLLISRDINGKGFQEQGDIKLNLAELLQKGEPKIDQAPLVLESAKKTGPIIIKTESHIEKGDRIPLPKNELGTEFTIHKTDKGIRTATPVNQVRDAYNLPLPLPKILDRMIWMVRAGEQNSRIMIHPPELGRLDLDLAIKNGHLQVNMSAESVMVKEIIEANLSQLKQQLNDQGLIVDRFEVMVGLDNRQFKEGDLWAWNDRKGSSSKRRPGADIGDLEIEEKPLGQSMDNHYQIDVHV